MPLVWLSLVLALAIVAASAVFATRRALELYRAFRQLARATGSDLERIERSSAAIERHLTLAAESGTRLDASLSRLRASRARLNVQRAAIDDVRASLGRITSHAPRK
jgi:hypothetical protein